MTNREHLQLLWQVELKNETISHRNKSRNYLSTEQCTVDASLEFIAHKIIHQPMIWRNKMLCQQKKNPYTVEFIQH